MSVIRASAVGKRQWIATGAALRSAAQAAVACAGGAAAGIRRSRHCRPRTLSASQTAGQRHESAHLEAVLDAIRVPRPGGRGRPRKRPDRLIADRGSGDRASRTRCRSRKTSSSGMGSATRDEKRAALYRAMVVVAATMIWLGQ